MFEQITRSFLILLLALPTALYGQTRLQGVVEHLRVDSAENSSSSLSVRVRTSQDRIFEFPEDLADDLPPRARIEFSPSDLEDRAVHSRALIDNITIIENPGELTDLQHRALIVSVQFNDGEVSCKSKKLNKILYKAKKNVRDWFLESSYQNVDFNFDSDDDGSADIVTAEIDASVSDSCDYDSWANDADTAVEALGYDLSSYEHITYLIPETTSCDWGGLGTVSCGTSCRVWVRQCKNKALYMHEYGHNLGFDHASLDENGDEESDQEYGDTSCPMGTAATTYRHFNGPHKAQAGWIPDEQIVLYDDESHVKLTAVEIDPATLSESDPEEPIVAAVQVVKLPIPESKIGIVFFEHYYASFRKKIGKYSKALANKYKNGITIHKKHALSGQTVEVATLAKPNESFTATNGSVITYLDRDGDSAVVWLSQDGNSAPTFTYSGTIEAKSGSALSADELAKVSILFKKKFTKDTTTATPDESGNYSAELSYGTYIIKIRYPKKRYSLAKSEKKQRILVSADTTYSYSLKRK